MEEKMSNDFATSPKKKRAPRKKKVIMPAEAWTIKLTTGPQRVPFTRTYNQGNKTYYFQPAPTKKIEIGNSETFTTAGTSRMNFARTGDSMHDFYYAGSESEIQRMIVISHLARENGLPATGIKQMQYIEGHGYIPIFDEQILKASDKIGDINLANYRESLGQIRKAIESGAFTLYSPYFFFMKDGRLKLTYAHNFIMKGERDFNDYYLNLKDLLKKMDEFAAYAADPSNKDQTLRHPFDNARSWMKTEGERQLRAEAANMEIVTEDWSWEQVPFEG